MVLDRRQIIPVDKNPVKSIHPDFIDMLRRAESDNLYAVSNCGDIYKEVICDESAYLRSMGDTSQHVSRMNKPVFCRKRHECYRCARLENIRLRDVSRQKFAEVARCAGSEVEFGWMTYTMGYSVWKHITEDNIGEYVQLAIEVTKELFGEDLVIGGVASPHYWHSKKPFAGWMPHVHIIVNRFAWNKKFKQLVKVPRFIDHARWNRLWMNAVNRKYGENQTKIHVKYRYSAGFRELNHMLQYNFRYAVQDLAKDIIVRGVRLSSEGIVFAKRLLAWRKNARHVFNFGYMANNSIGPFVRKLNKIFGTNVVHKTAKDLDHERRERAKFFPHHPKCKLRETGITWRRKELEPGMYVMTTVSRSQRVAWAMVSK